MAFSRGMPAPRSAMVGPAMSALKKGGQSPIAPDAQALTQEMHRGMPAPTQLGSMYGTMGKTAFDQPGAGLNGIMNSGSPGDMQGVPRMPMNLPQGPVNINSGNFPLPPPGSPAWTMTGQDPNLSIFGGMQGMRPLAGGYPQFPQMQGAPFLKK